MEDSLHTISNTIVGETKVWETSNNLLWFSLEVIAILLIAFVMGIRKHRKSNNYRLKQKIKNKGSINFDDIITTALSKEETETLRRELLAKCHPDRFVGSDKMDEAHRLYIQINNASNSLELLKQLQTEVDNLIYK